MHITLLALTLLTVVGLTGLIARVLKLRIPMPLLQIAAGAAAALAGVHVGLDTDLFLLLFISPLLFLDAYRVPMREFGELRGVIVTMAVGLVALSTLAGGYFLDWLLPTVPLAAAFALAGALSPTDAISVSGILRGGRTPPRIIHLLRGEALLNDASGLVCFKFAVAAATTGIFSLKAASANFVWVSLGGIVTGAIVSLCASRAESMLLRRGYDDPPSHMLLALILPFFTYLVAESIETSGILAVVAAGMTIRLTGVMNETEIGTRMRATALWETISFALNGLVFLLLGLQLPDLVHQARAIMHSGGVSPWELPIAIVALQVVMTLSRLAWVSASILARRVAARLWRRPFIGANWPEKLILALAGTRGTITLAAILSLPSAEEFPERSLLITIAAGVIIISLLVASIFLPLVLRLLPSQEGTNRTQQELDETRLALVRVAIGVLKDEAGRHNAPAGGPAGEPEPAQSRAAPLLLQEYQELLHTLDSKQTDIEANRDELLRNRRAELAIRLRVVRAQRKALKEFLHDGNLNDETERVLARQLDVHEQELIDEASALPHP
ncbi:Na+/H+ antiporter [Acetobacter sp. DsW_063]|uniref:Na+/H+ antiporter n=1 Tax=Acetobacter sp. DsW_063 TaxID=1514894 RepID=UPI000A39E1F6|nr:Na+/H+ antiporter [Acetobacter sp. DsW_063]OUJ15184.1 hypothetical protein HK28_08860 [Acetobacter sp. DsW_063]